MILTNNSNQQNIQQRQNNTNFNRGRYNLQNQNNNINMNLSSQPEKVKDKQVRMSISFKDDEKWLYDLLKQYSCPTGTIKDILKSYFNQNNRI